MLFRKREVKADVTDETLKLRLEMVDTLLKFRYSWEEIERGLGFSEAWYRFTKQMLENHSKS